MKNKIVKALVLASIVSMTATGAAGLTFAEDQTPAKPTTIDGWAKEIATDQAAADKAKAEFDKVYALTDAKTDAKKAYSALVEKEKIVDTWMGILRDGYFTYDDQTHTDDYKDPTKKAEADAFRNYENQYQLIKIKEDAWGAKADITPDVDHPNVNQGAAAVSDEQTAYNNAKTVLGTYESIALGYETIKTKLETALNDEKTARAAFEEAMKAVEEKAENAPTEAQVKEKAKAYNNALKALAEAKEEYDKLTENTVPIYRLYHPGTGEHLYTDGKNERDTLVKGGVWKDEKVAMLATNKDDEEKVPVYRVCYPLTGDHHYTTSKYEVTTLINTQGWVDEGIAFYAKATGKGVSVYRLYNKGLKLGAHHFTTGLNEYNTLEDHGWRKEGVAFDALAADYVDTSAIKTTDDRLTDDLLND